ncbi:cbb3-type cytochrome c oxidase subunit I [Lysobacter enzymogenes]|uniref:cbb3-type cytochrome c oxidase subunit I n=1 Tax=Lysobacter enzymogenes TaxID=69 RepID=UPI00099C00CE|nr:cbb3-type cytochrome c oxidase subunit I [Lysobacter enzymogenes]UZW62205.1 cbb3-type cytochrome c oxidase subunit I [Lysobacter enzymogenes]
MLGRLNYDALPFYSPIALGGAAVTVLGALAVIALLTWLKRWGWLWREWLTSADHKKIGIMYVVLALVMLLRGFADGIMMRFHQAMAVNAPGYLEGDHFQQVFSAHGSIMIFFMAMPFFTGLANYVVPLQIGARDVSFPFLNALSYWLTVAGAGLVLISLVIGKFSTAGWTGYPPYSLAQYNDGVGVDYWIWALFISGFGTTLSAINLMVTILRRRANHMPMMDMPVFTWTVFCASIIILIAFPALTAALALLASDRLFSTHFFTPTDGGNFMNFANMFWMWGHPEVYILVLPAFGVFSEVVTTFSSKKLFGYKTLIYATFVITLISTLVWVHHFFTMGASPQLNAVFGIATMVIGIPTGVKVFNWLFTMYRGRIRMHSTIYWTVGFMVLFVIGGMTGVLHAIPAVDYNLHNTTFLVAHFHNMIIPGVLFGYIAGYQYWFPKAFGFQLDERWGKRAFWGWFFGFCLAFFPLYVLGLMGLPRRSSLIFDEDMRSLLYVAAGGAVLILLGILCLVVQLYVSIRNRHALRDATGDPWDGRTLEWSIPSPAPFYNFARSPKALGLDAFAEAKERKIELYEGPYPDIEMPKSSPAGFVIGVAAFVLGFGVVFWIWWLAAIAFATIFVVVVMRMFEDHGEYELHADEVARLDRAHRGEIAP